MAGFERLQHDVIGVGLCTGCGTCVGVCPSKCLAWNYDSEEPKSIASCPPRCQLCSEVCPGKEADMLRLDCSVFGKERGPQEETLGVCRRFFRGQAVDDTVRLSAASGGAISALLIYALERGLITGALVAGMDSDRPWRAVPKIARNKREVIACAQSKLTIVPTVSMLGEAVGKGLGNLAVAGLPCHIHGIRKTQLYGKPKKLVNAVKFTVGLLCGSNWSYRATEHVIAEVCGVPLDQVTKVEYRHGEYPGMFTVWTKDGRMISTSSAERRLWSEGFVKRRCLLCYDYSAELADVSVGDFFDPQMQRGAAGWSVLAVRTEAGDRLVKDAGDAGYLRLEPVDGNYLLGIGYERKRHGHAYQIMEATRHGLPTPQYNLPIDYQDPAQRKVFLKHPHLTG